MTNLFDAVVAGWLQDTLGRFTYAQTLGGEYNCTAGWHIHLHPLLPTWLQGTLGWFTYCHTMDPGSGTHCTAS